VAALRRDALEEREREVAENTGKSRESNVVSALVASSAEVAELADAQDSKSGGVFSQVPENTSTCENPQNRLGAFLGASAATPPPLSPAADPDLAAVLSAWPHLPEPVKAGILAMVKATEQR
jgi:hypothetical protein